MGTRPNRWWNFTSASILFFALLITSLKIQSTGWTDDLFLLNWLTFIGYILGLLIGYSLFKPFIVTIFTFFYSIIILPWSIGLTYASSIPWITRLENIYGRIYFSINQLLTNTRIDDPILFFTFLSLLIWFTGIFAGFFLVRKSHFWIPILISGITIFASDFYDQSGNHLYTGFFIFFVLILISQVSYQETGRNWRLKGIPVDGEVTSLVRRTAFFVSIIIVFLAWNVPNIVSAFQKDSPQQRQVIALIAEIQNQFAKITAPLQGTAYIQSEFFSNTVNLGTGSELSDEIVFEITVDQRQPIGVRYYWKARSYDTYQNGQWISSIESSANFEANEIFNQTMESQSFSTRTFSITTNKNIGLLYAPPYPQKINFPVKAYFQILPDENIDITTITLEKIAFSGEQYVVTNMVLNPTIEQLRKTSEEYPDWISQKYLQLPSGFSDRVTSLAIELTSTHENPYDKTMAITNYLRNNISYNDQIPTPPVDQDIIEWFLFDLRQGFCNFYATAEVLMLRSVGIPARIAFGYAEGEALNNSNFEFKVTREQLHAWPEVYFSGIGWVEFEPTVIQPSIDRLPGESFSSSEIQSVRDPNRLDLPVMDGGESFGEGSVIPEITPVPLPVVAEQEEKQPFILYLLILVSVFLLIVLISSKKKEKLTPAPIILERIIIQRGWKTPKWLKLWASYLRLSEEKKAFSKIIFSLLIFNKTLLFSLTPAEIAYQYKLIFPEMRSIVNNTLLEYQKAIYSNYSVDLHMIKRNTSKILRYSIVNRVLISLRMKKWQN